ncbi:MAG: ComEA family DNA-binding protein [Candidatus Binatia bacterium]
MKSSKWKGHASFMLVAAIAFSASCTGHRSSSTSNIVSAVLSENAVDINSASAVDLAKIDHIGPKHASAIVDFRERHGRFRRTEDLMLIRGISDSLYREIRALVKTE